MRNLFKNRNTNIQQLIRGSSTHAFTQVLATGLGFFASTQIARYYGPSVVGNIATITSVLTLLSLFSLVGNQTFALRVIPQQIQKGGHGSAFATYKNILQICLYSTASLLTAWMLAEHIFSFELLKGLKAYLYFTMALIFINVYAILNGKTLRALGDYKYFSFLDFLPASLSLVTITLAITLKINPDSYQYLHFLPRVFIVLLAFYFVNKIFSKVGSVAAENNFDSNQLPTKRALLRSSLPMLGITISTAAIAHLDIIMLNFYSTPTQVGIYSIYVKVVGVAAMATISINAMFAPKVSALHAAKNHTDLRRYSKQVTMINFLAAAVLTTGILLFHRLLLSYFGSEFLDNLVPLYILLCSNLITAFFGSVGFYLSMTGNQNSFFWIMLGAAIMNAALNYLLIPVYGITGAAFATLVASFTSCVWATMRIKSLTSYTLILNKKEIWHLLGKIR